ncbi:MAG: hypothetical protein AB7O98_12710 [Hyphomonadaceae bacterium]
MLARKDDIAPTAATDRSLSDVLGAAAIELQHAYERGLRLEAAILVLMARNPASDGSDLAELQHLDIVLQHVNVVGEFLAAVATAPTDAAVIKAAVDRINLGEVRARLLGQAQVADADDNWMLG